MTADPVQKGPDEKFCHECGAVIRAKAHICPKCGVLQPQAPDGPNRLAAALLAILLGTIGAHKFYLGKTGQGILYLVLFWSGIPTLLGIIEGIIYLAMNDLSFAAKYGRAL